MAENVQQVQCDQAKADVESANSALSSKEIKELHTKKRMKRLAYITAFVLFQTVVILIFSLTVMNIKSPKFRIRAIDIERLIISDNNITSLDMEFNAEVSVKNANFGHFKFDESSVSFAYRGVEVGEASVEKEKARARSTKKMNVTAEVEINTNSGLENEVKSGFMTLTSQAKLSGKVHLMKVIKKKKTSEMNCTIVINLVDKVVHDLKCK